MTDTTVAVDPVDEALRLVWQGTPAVVVASPPGAGKTWLSETVASTMVAGLDEKVAVAAQTNAQAQDLARRFATNFPTLPVQLLVRSGAGPQMRAVMGDVPNVQVVETPKELSDEPGVTVSTSAKWAWVNPETWSADLLIVDEAWQITNAAFALITAIADRYLLVGDPGQIAPVTTGETVRWYDQHNAPHMPAPQALLAMHPNVPLLRLPVTRRFGQATTDIVQPAFYPDMPFSSARPDRTLSVTGDGIGHLNGVDAEVALIELEGDGYGIADPEVADRIAQIVSEVIETGTVTVDGHTRRLTGQDVGVVCAHVVQTTAVASRISTDHPHVMIDTAERWQGLEREVMVVWHPLSGRDSITEFGRDAGRLCVMLSRHKTGCVLVTRSSVYDLLATAAAADERFIGRIAPDSTVGWFAHHRIMEHARSAG